MSPTVLLAILGIGAYLLQLLFSLRQMKTFNTVYQDLRKQGKVAIGKRAGKIRAGTIVMFALDDEGKILDARKMQGVTVWSRFAPMTQFIGEDLHYIDRYHPKVRLENKLTQAAMEHAREVYLRVQVGDYKETPTRSPLANLKFQASYMKDTLVTKLKRSV